MLERHRARPKISGASRLPIRVELVYALAEHVGGGGATNSGGGARLPMSPKTVDVDQLDYDLALDVVVNIDPVEYRRIMGRIMTTSPSDSPVSAFNSSI